MDRDKERLRESHWVATSWWFESLLSGISSRLPLAYHFDFPGSPSIFGKSQDLPRCAKHFLAKMYSTQEACGYSIPWCHTPVNIQGAFLWTCVLGGFLTLGMRNMWSGQSSASFLNCPAFLVLEFQAVEKESPIALPRGAIPPASEP